MKHLIGLIILVFLLMGCKKGNFQNPLKKNYQITGTYYFDHNLRPIPFADLELYSVNLSSGSGEPKLLRTTTTDINGIFTFNYAHKKDLSSLYIQKAIESNPYNLLSKPLLKGIKPYENFTTDLFQYPFGNLRVRLAYDGTYDVGDTLFIAGLPLVMPNSFSSVNVLNSNLPGLIILFPIINDEFGPYRTYWNADLGNQPQTTLYFGIGRNAFEKSFNDTLLQQKVIIRDYPNLSLVRLKLD